MALFFPALSLYTEYALSQLTSIFRRIGPEKGVIHMATGAVDNALWDMYARSRNKPVWKLVVDMSPVRSLLPSSCPRAQIRLHLSPFFQEELVASTTFRYITDAITPKEALEIAKRNAATKAEREARVRQTGYPAYVTSAGWMGYDDEKIRRLTLEAIQNGFNHFKVRACALFFLVASPARNLTQSTGR